VYSTYINGKMIPLEIIPGMVEFPSLPPFLE
jgi:hypothetical protein